MRITITPSEMSQLEHDWMTQNAIPSILLMERAAQGVADAIARHIAPGGTALFLCGPGNNGGDGYAAARLWQDRGGHSLIWELKDQAKGDADVNRRLALMRSIPIVTLREVPSALPQCDAVVDALFGTGLTRAVDGIAAEVIRAVNDSALPVIAVDIPSGLHGGNGQPMGECIHADETVTFHRLKAGLLLAEGCVFTGRITLQDIFIPRDWGQVNGLRTLEPADLPRLLPHRPVNAHKGTYGRAVIFAGARGMAGAAALCAAACVKTGAGLTTLLCREAVLTPAQILAPGATARILPEKDGCLTSDAVVIAAKALADADRAAIGCGLGTSEDLLPLLRVFRAAACPVVWDADALNLLAVHPELLPLPASHVITPHPGEAARQLQRSVQDVTDDPLTALRDLHEMCGCNVLLKGARTLMTDGHRAAVNPVGTPALAKGGSGDILTGVLTALLGRVHALPEDIPLAELQTAALIHALAGIDAAKRLGEDCVTPMDVVQSIHLELSGETW